MTVTKRPFLLILTVIMALFLSLMLVSCTGDREPSGSAAPLSPDSSATDAGPSDVPDTATDVPAATADAPTDAPATDAPASDVPATEVPATDTPATEVPATDVPATDAPVTNPPEVLCWLGVYNERSPYGSVTIDGYDNWGSAIGGNEPTGKAYTVNAEPYDGYVFKEWQDRDGNVVSDAQEYTLTLEHDTSLYAIFEPSGEPYELLPSFGLDKAVWEEPAYGYDSADTIRDISIILGDKPLPVATKYIKPEFTAGDTDAFSFTAISSGNWAEPHSWYSFWVRVAPDLTAGTYSATLTLYYDANGTGSDWVAIDTCELTAVIKAQPAGRCWLGVYNEYSPYGKVTINGYNDWGNSIGGNELTGQTYTVNAEPGAGYDFKEWQDRDGNVVSAVQEYSFTLTQNTYLYAIFEKTPGWIPAPPSFEAHAAIWEDVAVGYAAHDTFYNVGIRLGDYPLPIATKYIKVEFTAGDAEAFSFTEIEGSNWAEPHEYYNFWVYIKSGLSAGAYNATLTLYYDAGGNGSDWVAVDTCELSALIVP